MTSREPELDRLLSLIDAQVDLDHCREAFDRPEAMLQNMLLDRVLPGLLLKDDNPLAIRVKGKAQAHSPTGCVLLYQTHTFDDALDVARNHQSHGT